MTFKDQLFRSIELQRSPKRIVSLVPSQTELLVDLGLEDLLVGITKFCVHPSHLKTEISIVGGTKQIHFDKLKALRPDIILCNKEENTLDMVEQLETIAPVHISDIVNIDQSLELISMYGNMFSKLEKSKDIIEGIKGKYKSFIEFIKDRPRLKVTYFIWKDPWMVAASNTFINNILSINNLDNVYDNLERYPEIQLDNIEKTDIILLPSEPYPFKAEHVFQLQQIVPKAKIILVDGEYFSWYGSRLLKAFDYFKVLHIKHFNQMV